MPVGYAVPQSKTALALAPGLLLVAILFLRYMRTMQAIDTEQQPYAVLVYSFQTARNGWADSVVVTFVVAVGCGVGVPIVLSGMLGRTLVLGLGLPV